KLRKAEIIVKGGEELKQVENDFDESKKAADEAAQSGVKENIEAAEQRLKKSVEDFKEIAGQKKEQTAKALSALSEFYAKTGRADEARALAQEACEIFADLAKESSPGAPGTGPNSGDGGIEPAGSGEGGEGEKTG